MQLKRRAMADAFPYSKLSSARIQMSATAVLGKPQISQSLGMTDRVGFSSCVIRRDRFQRWATGIRESPQRRKAIRGRFSRLFS
jgi:hypothetical protein